jgi:hypothetical protein
VFLHLTYWIIAAIMTSELHVVFALPMLVASVLLNRPYTLRLVGPTKEIILLDALLITADI